MTRRGVSAAFVAAVMLLVAACAGPAEESGPTTLSWYVGPERADVESLAESCSDASGGRYRIEVERLPDDVEDRHAELVRRLLARDDSIDLFSMDMAWSAELAAAQVLAPVPEDLKQPFAQDVVPAALEATTVDGLLVAAPWTFDPWLLWWRGNAAERAGLDTTKPITWDDLLAGAELSGRQVLVDDPDGEGLAAWVNALVVGAGGTLLEGEGRSPDVGLDSAAGEEAAGIVEYLAEARLGPDPTAEAGAGLARRGGFVVAPSSFVSDPDVATVAGDLQWAPYPQVADTPAAPATGAALAVPLYAPSTSLSYEAVSCLTSADSLAALMTGSGHSAARATTYDAQDVVAGYPLADVTRPALETALALPQTPYWMRVRAALEKTWTPLSAVGSSTPDLSQKAVRSAVAGGLP
ncbi:extracellular solute-binding protein [Aeromicrobium sp.]|uniref:extracellular solute-binding protein n=1 Tax=Aeromicrobium sp. TaxID=1871063 RepID=UPI004033BD49